MDNCFRCIAVNRLNNTKNTFSYCGENGSIVSDVKGIKRLMTLAEEGFSLEKGFTADKVVGKAAAFLMVYLGAKNVYAETLSKQAYTVFEKYGVVFSYKYLVPFIINRAGNDICPMEKTVLGAECPEEAYKLLKQKLNSMQG